MRSHDASIIFAILLTDLVEVLCAILLPSWKRWCVLHFHLATGVLEGCLRYSWDTNRLLRGGEMQSKIGRVPVHGSPGDKQQGLGWWRWFSNSCAPRHHWDPQRAENRACDDPPGVVNPA